MIAGFFQDLRHSVRILAKNPGFACVAILSIAIGVGANAAMFSMADGLLLRPLSVPRAGDVMTVAAVPAVQGLRNPVMSYRDYIDVPTRRKILAEADELELDIQSPPWTRFAFLRWLKGDD